jgi:cytochrome c-type biogenesis protein CcmH
MKRIGCIAALFWLTSHAFAAEVYQLPDPVQQKTYESLTSQLRCLVCQNQTIADSHAELAGDLRRQVYEMLQQGKSEQEIVQFMTDRYGDFVLYNPPFKAKTGLLWLGPALFLVVGLLAVIIIIRRKSRQSSQGLEPSQREKIRSLLDSEEKS